MKLGTAIFWCGYMAAICFLTWLAGSNYGPCIIGLGITIAMILAFLVSW